MKEEGNRTEKTERKTMHEWTRQEKKKIKFGIGDVK